MNNKETRAMSERRWRHILWGAAVSALLISASAAAAEPDDKAPAAGTDEELMLRRPQGPTRIDFDERTIKGQSNQSGAVYLFERKKNRIRSMVRTRLSFRHLTVLSVYDK